MTQHRLPAAALHRFPGEPRPGRDVDVYECEGIQYVSSARKGVSFLRIDDASGSAGLKLHAAYQGQCHLTAQGAALSDGFAMVEGAPLRWPPPTRGVPRCEQPISRVVGGHYSLAPLVDMPMTTYAAEVERIKSSVCGMVAAATGAGADDKGPPSPDAADWLQPSDCLMVWVSNALKALSEAASEPASVRSTAWILNASICAADTTFEELMSQPDLCTWALAAMEQYEVPDEGDPVAESDCWHIELRLRDALRVPLGCLETPRA